MGSIKISIGGSFVDAIEPDTFTCSAEEGGHANAISRALAFLNERLPCAIKADHRLHSEGEMPPRKPFGEA